MAIIVKKCKKKKINCHCLSCRNVKHIFSNHWHALRVYLPFTLTHTGNIQVSFILHIISLYTVYCILYMLEFDQWWGTVCYLLKTRDWKDRQKSSHGQAWSKHVVSVNSSCKPGHRVAQQIKKKITRKAIWHKMITSEICKRQLSCIQKQQFPIIIQKLFETILSNNYKMLEGQ